MIQYKTPQRGEYWVIKDHVNDRSKIAKIIYKIKHGWYETNCGLVCDPCVLTEISFTMIPDTVLYIERQWKPNWFWKLLGY